MKKITKYIIVLICLAVIIFRLIFPQLKFDIISLSLLAIALFFILIKKPEKLFEKTKRIKIGSFELELKELNEQTEKIEKNTIVKKNKNAGRLSGPNLEEDIQKKSYNYELTTDFSTNILKLSIEIEKTLREIYEVHFRTNDDIPLSVMKLIEKLKTEKIINIETFDLLRKFWNLRNQTIHNHNFEIDNSEYTSFTDIGIRILKILRTIKNNRLNQGEQYVVMN